MNFIRYTIIPKGKRGVIVLLAFLFGVGLMIPFVLPNGTGQANFQNDRRDQPLGKARSSLEEFSHPINLDKTVPVLKVGHDQRFDPLYGDSRKFWAFLTVFRVRHLGSKEGRRQIFALKYSDTNTNSSHASGWGIAFNKIANGVYPEVFWGAKGERGNWYRFRSINVRSGEWWVLAISLERQRYLVLHAYPFHEVVAKESDRSLIAGQAFRGAHDVGQIGEVSSSADLVLGSAAGRSFKGSFGFFGVALVPVNLGGWFVEATKKVHVLNSSDASNSGFIEGGSDDSNDIQLINGSLDH